MAKQEACTQNVIRIHYTNKHQIQQQNITTLEKKTQKNTVLIPPIIYNQTPNIIKNIQETTANHSQ